MLTDFLMRHSFSSSCAQGGTWQFLLRCF